MNGSVGIKEAFDARGAQPWPPLPNFVGRPHTTPQGSPNFYGTLCNITLSQAMDFFKEHGYDFVESGESSEKNPRATTKRTKRGPALGDISMTPVKLGEMMTSLVQCAPSAWYEALSNLFSLASRFYQVRAQTRSQLAGMWPSGAGVYVVRKVAEMPVLDSILYIGMTGILDKELAISGNGFVGRMLRYTPYRYTKDDHFKFGPNASGDKVLDLPEDEQYQYQHQIGSVVADCFVLTGAECEIAPSLLEAILLQMYVSEKKTLPPGNREF